MNPDHTIEIHAPTTTDQWEKNPSDHQFSEE
jgi:hypothetical protein